ncbi:ABC transporter substrate-binding protein [Rhodococcus sp. HNM0569]|uniref:ABC transporter substrate-binding protein n=1 Tax=Rhodococcus sp. HNM0569 TaxID=2716340 RepID=UPI00146ABA6D|nr:ABC transporter substrate-binding protein [Rhodococcus sp. HNM0569]NLU83525.1 ABC transporter substrate-binding protein [Rhodococcus sp. HNM0569]
MSPSRPGRRLRRGMIALTAGLALALTGCSSSDSGSDASTDTSAADRTVTDSVGEVVIPADAERIVTVHHIATQPLINLGVVPVGRGKVKETDVAPETWEKIKDVPVVSDGASPNVEQVAQLQPDLIIAHNRIDEAALNSMREIAPVLVIDIAGPGRADWQGRVHLVAEALGKEDVFDDLVAKYDARAEEVANEHRDVLGREKFSLVGSWNPGVFSAYGSQSHFGSVFAKAGATISPAEEAATADIPEFELETSTERMPELLDGTVLLHVTDLRGQPNAQLATVMAEPIFQSVPAVQADRVFPGGKDTVGGFEDANYNLDQFDQVLTQLESQQ